MSLASIFGWEQEEKKLTGVNIVDFSQIVLSTMMATYKPNDEINIDIMRHLCLNTLRSNVLKNKQRYPTVVIAVDAKDGYWRRELAYYYKKNRKAARDKDEWDWDTIFEGMNTVVEEIKENLPYIVVNKSKTEADDVIGVLTKHIAENHPTCPILITSADGDFTQLHKYKQVKQWSPIQKKWVLPKNGSPLADLRFKIVKGDRKDGISTIMECSDWNFTKPEGARSKPINTNKFLNPIIQAEDPLSLDFLTDDQKKRYKENEILLDFEKIPAKISEPIIDEFVNGKVASRSKIYPYFVSKRLMKLLDSVNEF